MEKISVLAITKNGIKIGQNLKEIFPDWNIFVPAKLSMEITILCGMQKLLLKKL